MAATVGSGEDHHYRRIRRDSFTRSAANVGGFSSVSFVLKAVPGPSSMNNQRRQKNAAEQILTSTTCARSTENLVL
jgi:hypothetical protein